MYTKLAEDVYQCNECYKTLKTEKGITKHVNKEHLGPVLLKEAEKVVEEIRTTSVSIHEVVARLVKFWRTQGIEVTFNSYPTSFSLSVSNSHESPEGYAGNWNRDSDKPTGYPGWSGTWDGTVKVLDSQRWDRPPYFSDVIGSWSCSSSNLPRVTWLKTGSGGGGDIFKYDGKLFLYDFPLMHEQFKANGEEYKVLEHNYMEAIDTYSSKFIDERERYVKNSNVYSQALELRNKAQAAEKNASEAFIAVQKHLRGEFATSYTDTFPVPQSIFVNDEVVKKAATESNPVKTPPPNLKKAYKYIEKLSKDLSDYMKDHPEVFI